MNVEDAIYQQAIRQAERGITPPQPNAITLYDACHGDAVMALLAAMALLRARNDARRKTTA